MYCLFFFFFKQKTAYEMRISDWSSECALPIWPGPCTAWKGRGAGHSLIARQGGADGATHLPTGLFTDTQGRRNERAKTSRISRRQIGDRKSVVSGKSVSVRVDLGGRRIIKKNKRHNTKQEKSRKIKTKE